MVPNVGKQPLKPRPATRKHLYAIGGGDDIKYLYKYDIKSNTWDRLAPVNKRRRHTCLYANEEIITLGGWNHFLFDSKTVGTMESLNVNSGQVRNLKPMKYPRANLSAVYLRNEIYALGGNADICYNSLKTVEK